MVKGPLNADYGLFASTYHFFCTLPCACEQHETVVRLYQVQKLLEHLQLFDTIA